MFSTIQQFLTALWNAKIKVEPLIFLYLFTWSFYFPLYEQYYYVRFGSEVLKNTTFPFLNGSDTFCLNSSVIEQYGGKDKSVLVQSQANHLVTYGQLANRLPSIFIVIVIGPLSDRFGRKPILLASAIGLVLQSVVAVVITSGNLSPYLFILSNFLTGMCGDITGILAGGFAYISDVSSTKWRTFRIGVVCSLFEVGVALGTFLCGYWLSSTNCNFVPPMWLVLACSLAIVVWILVLVRESLNKKDKIKAKEKHPNLYTSFLDGLKLFACKGTQKSMWKLWAAILILDVAFINAIGNQLVAVFFLKSPPFDATPLVVGIFQALISVSSGVCATLVIAVISVVLCLPDSFSALLGLVFQCSANILMGFAKTNTQVFLSKYWNINTLTKIISLSQLTVTVAKLTDLLLFISWL